MAPPPRLRVLTAACPSVCGVRPGPEGLRLTPVAAPSGATLLDTPPLALVAGAPYPTEAMHATAGGRILLTWGEGFARTVLVPDLAQAFDRRPPGLCECAGASEANAGLLRAAEGWRAVVLPSMGDRLPDLGPGPVAIAHDGRRVAAAGGDGVVEMDIADGARVAHHDTPAQSLAYGADGMLHIAREGRLDGGPAIAAVTRLAGASASTSALAVHDDDLLRLHGPDGPGRGWASPVGTPRTVALTANGEWAALAGDGAVAVVRAADGALAALIDGAVAIAFVAGGRIAIAGPWGIALAGNVQEHTA